MRSVTLGRHAMANQFPHPHINTCLLHHHRSHLRDRYHLHHNHCHHDQCHQNHILYLGWKYATDLSLNRYGVKSLDHLWLLECSVKRSWPASSATNRASGLASGFLYSLDPVHATRAGSVIMHVFITVYIIFNHVLPYPNLPTSFSLLVCLRIPLYFAYITDKIWHTSPTTDVTRNT